MNPEDFLSLAVRLSAAMKEAESRSAVSRAYYGIFHLARSIVEACEVRLPESAAAHEHVTWCLEQSGDPELAVSASKLHAFRKTRNDADYVLTDRRFVRRTFIALQIAMAQELFAALTAARSRLAAIRPHVRKYAREVLRLTVTGTD